MYAYMHGYLCIYTYYIYIYRISIYIYIRTEEEGWPPSGANEDTLFIAWGFSKLLLRASRFQSSDGSV